MFDFDGLIADTETPEFESWSQEFREHGATLDIDVWIQCVGAGPAAWDVVDHLVAVVGKPLDREGVIARRRERYLAITREMRPMPGVRELLGEANASDLPCGIASSSTSEWVGSYLERFKLQSAFRCVVTRDLVGSPKPAPDLFLAACARLEADPTECVALEDSVNGVAAAKAAGLFCIAVPNSITAKFDFGRADHRAASLKDLDLQTIASLFSNGLSKAQT